MRIPQTTLPVLLTILLALATPPQALGQSAADDAAGPASTELVIGVREASPFSIRDGEEWRGLSIRAWEDVAARNGWSFRYVPAGLDEVLSGTDSGRFDVGLGAFTVTAERERTLDFSHPFYTSGLGLAVRSEPQSGWLTLAARFFSLEFLTVAASLGALLLVFGVLVWLFERRANPEEFDARVGPGIGAGFWWAAVTMTTVGYGDKSPRSLGGRVVALVWMFAAIIVISGFTAAITTSLTVSQLGASIESIDDLEGRRIATLGGSASAEWLKENGFRTQEFDTLDDALDAVENEQAPAALYDAPLLVDRLAEREDSRLQVLPERVERLDYAFMLPEQSQLREPINRELLEVIGSEAWDRALDRFLPES